MTISDTPAWLLFVVTTVLVVATIELGYKVGERARRSSRPEKESPVSAISGAVLALLAFILAFTFSIVADRYDARKALVLEQALSIRSAYEASELMPEPTRGESKALYLEYVDLIVEAGRGGHLTSSPEMLSDLRAIQAQLWQLAVDDVRRGDNSDIAAYYVELVDEMRNGLATRVAVSVQARIPNGLWLVLYLLVGLGMFTIGYQTAIADSRRTLVMVVLALSFSIVITLIAALDDPEDGIIAVTQQPLRDLQIEVTR